LPERLGNDFSAFSHGFVLLLKVKNAVVYIYVFLEKKITQNIVKQQNFKKINIFFVIFNFFLKLKWYN
jgi:hypothetical protein